MSELTLLILRLAFLAVLWLFVFAVVYALRSDLFGHRLRRASPEVTSPFAGAPIVVGAPTGADALVDPPTEPVSAPRTGDAGVAKRLVITSGPKEGLEIELPSEQLAIGRSSESGLVIRDDYTSTHHARLLLWNDGWVVQDLDSTNGTFLDGTRVTLPTLVPLNTPVTIGTTTFELRR